MYKMKGKLGKEEERNYNIVDLELNKAIRLLVLLLQRSKLFSALEMSDIGYGQTSTTFLFLIPCIPLANANALYCSSTR